MEPPTGGIIMTVAVIGFSLTAIAATYWPIAMDWIKERNKIRNFVVKVRGPVMTSDKFGCLNDDINLILGGSKLSEVVGDNKKQLTNKNIIGITDMPGENCHYFVIWFRR